MGKSKIRFYAGCPLTVPGLGKMATLCIIDQKPRTLDEEDMEAFRDLASVAERELSVIQLATLDELTGITNRRGFMAIVRHALDGCIRQQSFCAVGFPGLE